MIIPYSGQIRNGNNSIKQGIGNKEWKVNSIPYSGKIRNGNNSIKQGIRNKEWKVNSIPYSLFWANKE